MGAIASQITSLTIVYSTVYSDADQRKHQNPASLAFVRETDEFPAQMASNAENVSIWWRHHESIQKPRRFMGCMKQFAYTKEGLRCFFFIQPLTTHPPQHPLAAQWWMNVPQVVNTVNLYVFYDKTFENLEQSKVKKTPDCSSNNNLESSTNHRIVYTTLCSSLRPRDVNMRQTTWPSLVKAIAWRLFGVKLLPEPTIAYRQLCPYEYIQLRLDSRYEFFLSG